MLNNQQNREEKQKAYFAADSNKSNKEPGSNKNFSRGELGEGFKKKYSDLLLFNLIDDNSAEQSSNLTLKKETEIKTPKRKLLLTNQKSGITNSTRRVQTLEDIREGDEFRLERSGPKHVLPRIGKNSVNNINANNNNNLTISSIGESSKLKDGTVNFDVDLSTEDKFADNELFNNDLMNR